MPLEIVDGKTGANQLTILYNGNDGTTIGDNRFFES